MLLKERRHAAFLVGQLELTSPFCLLCHKSSLNGLEVGVEWVLGGAVDVDLVEHVEGDVVLLDEVLDLGIAARLLTEVRSSSSC